MWGKIMILMYRLWLHSLYGLHGHRCSWKADKLNYSVTHSLTMAMGVSRSISQRTIIVSSFVFRFQQKPPCNYCCRSPTNATDTTQFVAWAPAVWTRNKLPLPKRHMDYRYVLIDTFHYWLNNYSFIFRLCQRITQLVPLTRANTQKVNTTKFSIVLSCTNDHGWRICLCVNVKVGWLI